MTMADIFRFKQFTVNQTGCAMKINTDGVLLGALAEADEPITILDIGTGTGVIAMMMAQRFKEAMIDAVEIDEAAAKTAGLNFSNSIFNQRLKIYPVSIDDFLDSYPQKKHDLIISNPPFHLSSLQSPEYTKTLAKHTGAGFFETLMKNVSRHLTANGVCWLVLPIQVSQLIKGLTAKNDLYIKQLITIHSFKHSEPHREILALTLEENETENSRFVIYDAPNKHSDQYQTALRDFFTIF